MSAAKNVKRSLRTISAHGKLEAIRRVHDGESKASVARDIGVPESTLRGWCKNESKISYLSRQSSPDTDESIEPKEKRSKIVAVEDPTMIQPFNLSLKSAAAANIYTPPNSESLYTPMDYTKTDIDCTPKTPQNLSIKNETPKSTASQISERERNRAELARLSVELGLNRPEMFTTTTSTNTTSNSTNLADLAANISLLSQWNNIIMQHQLLQNGQQQSSSQSKKVAADTTSSNLITSSSTLKQQNSVKLPKEQQSVEEYINSWLKAQEAMLTNHSSSSSSSRPNTSSLATSNGVSPTSVPPPVTTSGSSSNLNGVQSSWFWNWYKQLSYSQQAATLPPAAVNSEKPILYQQLTKEAGEIENLAVEKPTTTHHHHHHHHKSESNNTGTLNNNNNNNTNNNNNKTKSVLDNLLLINNNNLSSLEKKASEKDNTLTYAEAMEHGEKFLRWLESYSNPSVTAMQIMQFKSLLNNVKNSVDRKNGDLQNKTKVKRK